MRRVATFVAVVLVIAIAIVASRARKKAQTVPTLGSASVAPPLAEPPELVVVKTTKRPVALRRGDVEVTGIVKDLSGGTVGGATVTVTMAGAESKVGQVVQSDANGELHAWVDAGEIRADATADGYAGATWSGVAPGQRIELVLTPESVLEGRVVEAGSDRGVAGALVVADSQDDDVSSKGVTDASGHFRLRALAPGHYKPEAVTPNRWGTARASVLLGLAETVSDVVIAVHPSLAVSGRVLRGEAGCSGATVSLTSETGSGFGETRSADADAEGNVQLEGIFPGTYEVVVQCAGGVAATYPPVVVQDGSLAGLVWKTETGFSIRGTVFDERGRVVAGVSVMARNEGDASSAETEPDGTFVVRTLRGGGTYELVVSRAGVYSDAALATVAVEHDVEGLRLTLPATGGVRGSVVDDRGVAVNGVTVEIDGDHVAGHAERTVRDDGTFAVDGLLPGSYHVVVGRSSRALRFPGIASDAEQFKAVTITTGGVAVLKLVVESERGVLRGRVLDGARNPLADVFVEALRHQELGPEAAKVPRHFDRADFGGDVPVVVDPDGRFTIGKLGPGTYAVRAYRKGGGDAILDDVALGSDVTLVIEDEAALEGRVSGATPDRFTVSVDEREGRLSRVESFFRTDGVFAIRDLPAGSYDVIVESKEGRGATQVTLAAGQRRGDLAIEMLPYARIRGRVVAADDGTPVADLSLFLTLDGSGASASLVNGTTDADGRFELRRVPSGRLTLSIPAIGSADVAWDDHEEKLSVGAGATVDLPPIRLARRPTAPKE